MRRSAAALVACALLAACGPPPEARVTEQAKAAMKARMIDPGSARFENLYIIEHGAVFGNEQANERGKWRTVCGQVNGKNRAGQYVGFRSFGWSDRDGALRFDGSQPATIKRQRAWCDR